MSIEFLLTSLIVVVVPGTGVIYTLSVGLTRGGALSVVAAFGCTLGILPHMLAAVLGVAALLHTSALAFEIFKIIGVLYLLYMAWSALREGAGPNLNSQPTTSGSLAIVIKAILINLLNPKLSVFFLAFLPQFIAPQASTATLQMLGLGAVFMAMTLVIFAGYGLFAARVRQHVVSNPTIMKWMSRLFAGAFAALGLKLAFQN